MDELPLLIVLFGIGLMFLSGVPATNRQMEAATISNGNQPSWMPPAGMPSLFKRRRSVPSAITRAPSGIISSTAAWSRGIDSSSPIQWKVRLSRRPIWCQRVAMP